MTSNAAAKAILITGATRGIGLAVAAKLAREGRQVVGIARGSGDQAFPGCLVQADLSSEHATADALERIGAAFEIEAVINNVGGGKPAELGEICLDDLRTAFELNVRTTVQVSQYFVGGMRERNHGRIVNIASRAIQGSLHRTSYSTAKSALIGCTRTWALELAVHGITVNLIAPGPIETEMLRRNCAPGSKREQDLLASIAAGRFGTADEVAALVCFLVGDEAGFITGQLIGVDGGYCAVGRI